jgi:cytochrome P450
VNVNTRLSQAEDRLPRASLLDTLRTTATALVPMLAQGVIARRPSMVALTGALGTDRKTVRMLQNLRKRYGPGPLRLRVPGRSVALVLSPDDVHRVLTESPEPFAMATVEKRGALTHFQPHGVLVSHGSTRGDRRRFNEQVLDTGDTIHGLAGPMTRKIHEEARLVLNRAISKETLTWEDFVAGWRRAIRRVVLGDAARDDEEISDLLTSLRYDANWGYLTPKRDGPRQRFGQLLRAHLDRAEEGSLAGLVAGTAATAETDPVNQIPHWLFASDPAGMATYRALALLATHSEQCDAVRAELDERDLSSPQDLPLLRSCVLESVRLWPTTAVVLRESTTETRWVNGRMPAGTSLLIISSFFHRDEQTVPQANRFDPRAWIDGRTRENWSLFPFSGGPGTCPGRELVLFATSTFLGTLLQGHEFQSDAPAQLDPQRPLPHALNPFTQRFTVNRQPR